MQNLCSRWNCLGYFNSLSRFINKNKYDLVIYPSLSYYLYNHGSTLTKGDSAMTASLITIAYLTDTYLLTPNIQRLKRSYYDKTYYNTRYIVKQAHFKDAQGINQVLVTKCDNLNWTGWKKIRTVDGSTVNGNLRLVDKDGNKVRDIDHIYYHIYDKYGGFEMLNIKVNTLIHCIESKTKIPIIKHKDDHMWLDGTKYQYDSQNPDDIDIIIIDSTKLDNITPYEYYSVDEFLAFTKYVEKDINNNKEKEENIEMKELNMDNDENKEKVETTSM